MAARRHFASFIGNFFKGPAHNVNTLTLKWHLFNIQRFVCGCWFFFFFASIRHYYWTAHPCITTWNLNPDANTYIDTSLSVINMWLLVESTVQYSWNDIIRAMQYRYDISTMHGHWHWNYWFCLTHICPSTFVELPVFLPSHTLTHVRMHRPQNHSYCMN